MIARRQAFLHANPAMVKMLQHYTSLGDSSQESESDDEEIETCFNEFHHEEPEITTEATNNKEIRSAEKSIAVEATCEQMKQKLVIDVTCKALYGDDGHAIKEQAKRHKLNKFKMQNRRHKIHERKPESSNVYLNCRIERCQMKLKDKNDLKEHSKAHQGRSIDSF